MRRLTLDIDVVRDDIVEVPADVVALKYAQKFYGVDLAVSRLLEANAGLHPRSLQPRVSRHVLVKAETAVAATHVLFVGLPRLREIRYEDIHDFGSTVAQVIQQEQRDCAHLALTVHGPGFGLDEVESMFAMVDGLLEALSQRPAPRLRRISVVERDEARWRRLLRTLTNTPYERPGLSVTPSDTGWSVTFEDARDSGHTRPPATFGRPGSKSGEKPRIFVAMPFADEFDDLFEFGIQRPVRELGFLCERMDQVSFTGDVLERIKGQIETATATVAVLTGARPNVFLEIGYAWGKGRPTILISREGEESHFDVQGQRHLRYRKIQDVERLLTKELSALQAQGDLAGKG